MISVYIVRKEQVIKKSRLNTILFVFLIIASNIVTYILTANYWADQFEQLRSDKSASSEAKSGQEEEIENWKSYLSHDHGFAVKYPGNWILEEKTKNLIKVNTEESYEIVREYSETPDTLIILITDSLQQFAETYYYLDPDFLNGSFSFETVYRDRKEWADSWDIGKETSWISLGGEKGIKTYNTGVALSCDFLVEHNDKVYDFSFTNCDTAKDYSIDTMNRIMESLVFLD